MAKKLRTEGSVQISEKAEPLVLRESAKHKQRHRLWTAVMIYSFPRVVSGLRSHPARENRLAEHVFPWEKVRSQSGDSHSNPEPFGTSLVERYHKGRGAVDTLPILPPSRSRWLSGAGVNSQTATADGGLGRVWLGFLVGLFLARDLVGFFRFFVLLRLRVVPQDPANLWDDSRLSCLFSDLLGR